MEEVQKEKFNVETTDNKLDVVLVTALRENFEIKTGYHTDRNEILEFSRSVVCQHPDLEFVLHHRDTKLSGRVYKAFPKVTTKRVAVPNERGKKTWRYTNLRRISQVSGSEETKGENVTTKTTEQNTASREQEPNNQDNVAINDDEDKLTEHGLESSNDQDFDPTTDTKFSSILKWIKDNFVLDKNSSVQVRYIVDGIKAAFNTDVTYKQSHKLVFSVFPGASSRVAHPVRLEVRGSYYSYRGLAPKAKQGKITQSSTSQRIKTAKQKSSRRTKQTWSSSSITSENSGKPKVNLPRKCFLASCAALKDNLDVLHSMRNYEDTPVVSDLTAMENESSWRRMVEELRQERDQAIAERNQAMISLMEIEKEQQTESRSTDDTSQDHKTDHDTPRSSDEQEAKISHDDNLRDYTGETSVDHTTSGDDSRKGDDDTRKLAASRDDKPTVPNSHDQSRSFSESVMPELRSEERMRSGTHDWLQSLITRSNHILGEQMSQANSKYFPRSTLQNTSSLFEQVKPSPTGDYIEIERYEKLKNERDQIWKSWIDKLRREKESVIQQLKLEKMEVIQKMELEKSDAVDCIQEKLTNQITILTRELRELKELLSHTMDERTLAIEHAQKLMKLVDENVLKENGLDCLPFDVPEHQRVHRPRQQNNATQSNCSEEVENQKNTQLTSKGNKRKQSMPAKLIIKAKKTCGSAVTLPNAEKNSETGEEVEKLLEVGEKSERYLAETGTTSCGKEALVSDGGNVSSIDCLNSIVEKIGRADDNISPKRINMKTDIEL